MPATLDSHQDIIYFPLDQGERASHLYVDQLLPRAVYEKLAEMLQESLRQLPSQVERDAADEAAIAQQFSRGRGHSTVFLDGGRGTGKTTVIVNLQDYLRAPEVKSRFPDLANQVYILKPIDPSQLEDDDDLFLNVVVAAVLGDEAVQNARTERPQQWEMLHQSLQTLGNALSGKETQSEGIGLDRLRAFIGAQDLARAVHDFFERVAALLGTRLLVLPIDDVDTTLHRAFENLEVVRRYLASPALLPIVCGDLHLYRDVTWRDAFRRLTKDVRGFDEEAKRTANSLAVEYLRKILPLHRRLRMPDVEAFFRNERIVLGAKRAQSKSLQITLPDFEAWLRALLAGPVNDHENSRLSIPIPTVRALSQLLGRVQAEIPALERAFHGGAGSHPVTELMRRIAYRRRGETPMAYRRARPNPASTPQSPKTSLSLERWQSALLDHFIYEPDAGAVCLILMAARHWQEESNTSVLATPLFMPLKQISQPELRYVESRTHLDWKEGLKGRLPSAWLESIADMAVLPFATPEIGRAVVPDRWPVETEELVDDASKIQTILVDLITHRNFYSPSKRAVLICSGRVLELVVTSLMRDVFPEDIERILNAAPYHSAVAVASTKAAHIAEDDPDAVDLEDEDDLEVIDLEDEGADEVAEDDALPFAEDYDAETHRAAVIAVLAEKLNTWRIEIEASQIARSPWLIYCALNKTFNQAPYFTRPLRLGEQPRKEAFSDVLATGLSAFNAFWAAVASFEKGPIFDLPLELSNVNLLSRDGNFYHNNLFTQNILPLLKDEDGTIRGEKVVSITHALEEHPLRKLLENCLLNAKANELAVADVESEEDGKTYFLRTLGMSSNRQRITVPAVAKAVAALAPTPRGAAKQAKVLARQIAAQFPNLRWLSTLDNAIKQVEGKKTGAR
ncbi:antiviral RADAR system adenosine triphosphatase RdrA [Burkholderia ubonensis]|uniref:antiviral RADAR system adenosine triphosphatase RdrA n=1 Tax=Burkholderia ubonensis TaxID=101571 RepID=UPI0007530E6A|nr:antiviral RADAR system adenosine triphosphatase RdrA [Burkholderia ubonensis]AOI68437.1 hypothetical protein WI31_02415 [Burkholderia ubonensis]KUZ19442.1 hypothetical protein WI30_35610 [Burkholderia ubonensis]KUZ23210.1 hypothetical protein WI29_13565 [Burkholderia ubonensis]KUZ31175.1 hypothetical protein WI32_23575 [Burkholderia ubonensis]KUZ53634.1 hypothetical protein WI33_10275 [Burkholderia ubonensis]